MPALGRPIALVVNEKQEALCPPPVLSRLQRHRVAAGDTLEAIAAQYEVIPATIIGFNPSLSGGSLPVGGELLIPPYNGIRVSVPTGATWQELAEQYNSRADVLFELNGCDTVPSVVFIPGVNWTPDSAIGVGRVNEALQGYPLGAIAPVLRDYGWQVAPGKTDLEFHSGVDLEAATGTPVLSVGDGVVAFAGDQGAYGQLVVINHAQGLQTRYAQLSDIAVTVGQRIRAGQTIGTAGESGQTDGPHLHFEVRSNSNLGWVAQDPARYLDHMRMFER